MNITNYGLFGTQIFNKVTIVPIHIMGGVARRKINKGIVLQGGGRFGIKRFNYYFHESGVVDKYVFDNVVGGKTVKYAWFFNEYIN